MSNTDYTLNNIWKCQRDLDPDKVKIAEDIVSIIRSLFQHFSRLGKYDEMLTDTEKSFINDKESAIRNTLHSDLESYFTPVLQQDKLK